MVGWLYQLNGHEFEQTPGDSEGQGSLACCSPWGCKELDTTQRLNNNNNKDTVLKTFWYQQRDRHTDHWNQKENPVYSHNYGN